MATDSKDVFVEMFKLKIGYDWSIRETLEVYEMFTSTSEKEFNKWLSSWEDHREE